MKTKPKPRTDRRKEFTTPWVKGLRPEATPTEWRDLKRRGLVLRVETSGRKTWVVRYWAGGSDRSIRIGTFPETPLSVARDRALENLGRAQAGVDLQAEKAKAAAGETVAEIVKAWTEDTKLGAGARWRGGITGGAARSVMPHIRRLCRELGTEKLTAVTPKQVEVFVSRPEAPATRNRALTAWRLLMKWTTRKGITATDPSAQLPKEREVERSRTYTDPELAALIKGFHTHRYGGAVKLLAYTGLRRDEVLGARWDWVDLEQGVMEIPRAVDKSGAVRGEPRRVALSTQAVDLLKTQRKVLFAAGLRSSPFVFANAAGGRPQPDALNARMNTLRGLRSNGQPPSQNKRAPKRVAVIPRDTTLHDIRRTVANALLNRLHVAPWVIEHVVLGHTRPRLIRTYQPTLPLEEAREALNRWAVVLDGILAAKAAKTRA
jgi:integrase